MHKGYTRNYFINFFKNTKPSQWTCGEWTEEVNGREKHCALGFCGATAHKSTPKSKALDKILMGKTIDINDTRGDFGLGVLGKSPRTRVIKALKLAKKGKLLEFFENNGISVPSKYQK